MKKLIFFLCLSFITLLVNSQVDGMNFNPQKIGGTFQNLNLNSGNNFNDNMKGSIYLFKAWNNLSTLTSFSNKKLKIDNLNYDIENKQFVAKISNDSIYIFNNLKNVKTPLSLFENIDGTFYEILVSGKLQLLKEYTGKYKKAVINKMTNQIVKKPQYIKVETLYSRQNNTIKKIKLKKSSILKLLSSKKEEIKKYSKTNKLSYKKENDVIKILQYYNKLLNNF
ncbi:hypothetical protein DS884_09750 [Tenacibaculum sp. E3R01]|uniref:hypothetical protein n=1 Tax=Tenacibaculum sp. E3R01 TaxID=2267227 RepID=UPI000DEB8701|nr:hypothetical protein [Tenacibaculum sp. E3R01]RBW58138.1 hypothetical protein DS884_09750 [Tenacibaculum sp. E3R01]